MNLVSESTSNLYIPFVEVISLEIKYEFVYEPPIEFKSIGFSVVGVSIVPKFNVFLFKAILVQATVGKFTVTLQVAVLVPQVAVIVHCPFDVGVTVPFSTVHIP